MTGFSARRLATVGAASAASALAFMLPGAATASAATEIQGQGSSLQESAQNNHFIPAFNAKGAGQIKTYTGSGSGAGLKSWGNSHLCEVETYQYAGTDQPPNTTQKAAMETSCENTSTHTKAEILSIPTVQAAVAIVYHLPTGC